MLNILKLIKEEYLSLNEVGEGSLSPYSYTKSTKAVKGINYQYDYYFTTEDNDKYRVQIYYDTINQNWNVSFFANEDEFDSNDTDIFTNVINKGKLFKVMATVTSCINDFINIVHPKQIEVIPVKNDEIDERRFNLYSQYVKKNVPEGYRILIKNYGDLPSVYLIKKSLNEDEYQGEHSAPGKKENAPLYDVTKNSIYPEDIYSSNASRLYNSGLGDNMDRESLSIIQTSRKKPHNLIKIYRAVPDFNKEITKKLKSLYDIINYRNKFGFLPHNKIVDDLQNKYGNLTGHEYDVMNQNVIKDIQTQIENLKSQKESVRINNGDWVTINPRYAKQHGEDQLKNQYKVLTKTVRANQLYTDGNSIHEWGYNA